MIRPAVLFAAMLALVAPSANGLGAQPYAPTAVSAALAQNGAEFVAWAPGSALPDSFNVYGIAQNGALTLLLTGVEQPSAAVPPGFFTYGVAGVKGGVESQVVLPTDACIHINTDPPGAGITDCPKSAEGKTRLGTMLPLPSGLTPRTPA